MSGLALGEEKQAIDRIAQDLAAGPQSIDIVLAAYERTVDDPARRRHAASVLSAAKNGRLRSQEDLALLVEVLYFSGYQGLLAKHHVLFPAYKIREEYFINSNGPSGPVAPRRPRVHGRSWMLLGRSIGFPLGVPASVLTANAQWIHYFARNGFNVLTYKTVRSRAQEPNAPPNWVFLPQIRSPLSIRGQRMEVVADPNDWIDVGRTEVSTANSFGVPSVDPKYWEADLEESLNVLHDDQVLLVSVMGDDYDQSGNPSVLANDYGFVAKRAEGAGADIIELNLSCPNSLVPGKGVKPPLCEDPALTRRIVETVRDTVDANTQLVAKLSYMPIESLRQLLNEITPFIDAVSGINTLQSKVRRRDGADTFPGRALAGISGIAIRNHAREFVSNLVTLRAELGHRYEIIGMGGVTDARSLEALYRSGAAAVQSASGAFANPFLAWDCVESIGETLPLTPRMSGNEQLTNAREAILGLVSSIGPIDGYVIAAGMPFPPSDTFALLDALVSEGALADEAMAGGRRYRTVVN